MKLNFAIDRGGTFTDIYAFDANDSSVHYVLKLLSEDPNNYPDAPREGIRRILKQVFQQSYPRNEPLDTSNIGEIRMGTTVATNALLERHGETCALLITQGFQDLLYIGNQSRPKIFDLEIKTPEVIYQRVIQVDERVEIVSQESVAQSPEGSYRTGVSGELVQVLQPLNVQKLEKDLQKLYDDGIRSIAVVLMHSYTFQDHEHQIGELARKIGFTQVSLSSDLMPMVKIVPRGFTSCVDAYLTPVIKDYIESFKSGFDNNFEKLNVSFMQSDGGLTDIHRFSGHRAILSGPAGGVVGYAQTTLQQEGNQQAVIGFDMGGTSTDVSRYDGSFEHVYETTTAGVTIQAPQLDIHTVAAGGGSRLFFRDGMFSVGPESAGADPGPVCYRKPGGHLAVTDANLLLGRILPQYFPSIFGPDENESLDIEGTKRAFDELQARINLCSEQKYSIDEIAYGFIEVANEAMCRPIRNLTQMKGYDITDHILACFGGAGPQHACAIAKSLGIKTIFIHRFSGILSAYGLSLANVVCEQQEPCSKQYNPKNLQYAQERCLELSKKVSDELQQQGFESSHQKIEQYLNMRYEGTDVAIMIYNSQNILSEYDSLFVEKYKREFGFNLKDRAIIIDDIRVRGIGFHHSGSGENTNSNASEKVNLELPQPLTLANVYFKYTGRVDVPTYQLSDLQWGHKVEGPAIIMQNVATIVIEPDATAIITELGDVKIEISDKLTMTNKSTALNPIHLSIFSHRFMGIAEQMGRTLQRTSVSVNIKERLDFSCAIFSPDGGLVANAPHLPVHLGSMQQAVRYQLEHWKKENLVEGDVLVSNHPQLAGGSHLPDITVITPVFCDGEIVFFVASRGHHSDIGGIAPGSMPPLSKSLTDEGAAIIAFKLIDGKDGYFREKEITDLLNAPGLLPNNFGTRNLQDNLSDLKAQVAANNRGVKLMQALISEYSLGVVHSYMTYIQENAEMAVREMLYTFSIANDLKEVDTVYAEDFMDDGSKIALSVTIDRKSKSATFDFTNTGTEVYGNVNCPPSVTYSAIIYCLRCLLVGHDIPLNQGCLNPVDVILPKGSLLNPSDDAAVVGGNVLTSQRITDVILKAFKACAASQGCMNNLTFGDKSMGYYETIAGGAGAGPSWNGRSGVHTHMTNTRITDPEILERRYPVLLLQFSLRPNSGGKGKYHGGDGVIRKIKFRRPLTVSILSERRCFRPYGLNEGEPGSPGLNYLVRKGSKTINLGGKNTVCVDVGDVLEIYTPGGGGYGKLE